MCGLWYWLWSPGLDFNRSIATGQVTFSKFYNLLSRGDESDRPVQEEWEEREQESKTNIWERGAWAQMAPGGLVSSPAISVNECQLEPRPISPKWEESTIADSGARGTHGFYFKTESLSLQVFTQAFLHRVSMSGKISMRRAKWERKQCALIPDPRKGCRASGIQDGTALPTRP